VVGTKANMSGGEAATGPRFTVNEQTAVLGEDGSPVVPGSDDVGRLARRGHIPLGYYGDDEKTAATFLTIDGVRWVLPGDMAKVDTDGTVILLGRGSVSINTGGEKVFPEEVESALKAHPGVADAVVVGVPDDRWGERVVAVVQPAGDPAPGLEELQEFCRARVASYKVPRELFIVDVMVRSPAGKADYRWAKTVATGGS
jgi:acyl-CoA synthetase (AMP-forming)/AMP-acid ligase II